MIIKTYEDGEDLIVVFKGINADSANAKILKSVVEAITRVEPTPIENLSPAPPEKDEKPDLSKFEEPTDNKPDMPPETEIMPEETNAAELPETESEEINVSEAPETEPEETINDSVEAITSDLQFYQAVNRYAKEENQAIKDALIAYTPLSKNNRIRLKGLALDDLKKIIHACSPICKDAAQDYLKQKGFSDYNAFLASNPSEFDIKNLTIRCMNAVDKYFKKNIAA